MHPLACLPDPVGSAVLHAALDPPEQAARAWRSIRRAVDPAGAVETSEAHRLLPLVHRNLEAADIGAADRAALQARYDRTRAANDERIALAARWIRLLELGGVRASALKGVPLALRDYDDLGVRPMRDIDLLVPTAEAARALDLLEGAGWRDAADLSRSTLARLHHGSGMVGPGGASLDLHWHVAGFLTGPYAPRLEPIDVGGSAATTLDRTDTLVHVCLHGAWNGSAATTRWVADAVTVLRAIAAGPEALDRDRVVELGEAHGVGAILGAALAHVEREHAAPVPPGLAAELAAQRRGWRLRHRQRVVTAPAHGRERVHGLRHLRAYWAYTRWGWDDRTSLLTLPAFLTQLWGLDSPAELPGALLRRPLARLARPRGDRPRPP